MTSLCKVRKFSRTAFFFVMALVVISFPYAGLASDRQEKPGPFCNAKSCTPGKKGVVCGHWVPLIVDRFENGFPGTDWDNEDWLHTASTSSEGEYSIWSQTIGDYVNPNTVTHDSVGIPSDCDIIKVSLDYNYWDEEDCGWCDALMVYLDWGGGEW